MNQPDLGRLERLVAPVLEREQVELVDLRVLREGGSWVLRFFLDKAGGITLDDCERLSRRIEAVLDMEEALQERYVLEVSSPGVDRVLKRAADFERFEGTPARVRLRSPIGGQRRFRGVLRGVAAGTVRLGVDGRLVELPLDGIEEARLDPEI